MRRILYGVAAVFAISSGGCAFFNTDDVGVEGTLRPKTYEVFFDVEDSAISEAAANNLREVAENARQDGVSVITLSIHTGAAGWDAHSQALSQRRAAAVKAELIKDGVPASEIDTVGISRDPLVATVDGVREPQNRRTEIILR